MNDVQKAYVAGLMDGEGCFCIYTRKSGNRGLSYRPEISVGMTDRQAVEMLYQEYGGTLVTHHPIQAGWKERHTWKIAAAEPIKVFIEDIRPYLLVKIDQADALYSFCSARLGRPRRRPMTADDIVIYEGYRVQLGALNKRGVI